MKLIIEIQDSERDFISGARLLYLKNKAKV